MIDNMELGYTPKNLKSVRQKHGLTQQAAADLLEVNISALQRWEADMNLKSHADMPIKKWFELLRKLAETCTAGPSGKRKGVKGEVL